MSPRATKADGFIEVTLTARGDRLRARKVGRGEFLTPRVFQLPCSLDSARRLRATFGKDLVVSRELTAFLRKVGRTPVPADGDAYGMIHLRAAFDSDVPTLLGSIPDLQFDRGAQVWVMRGSRRIAETLAVQLADRLRPTAAYRELFQKSAVRAAIYRLRDTGLSARNVRSRTASLYWDDKRIGSLSLARAEVVIALTHYRHQELSRQFRFRFDPYSSVSALVDKLGTAVAADADALRAERLLASGRAEAAKQRRARDAELKESKRRLARERRRADSVAERAVLSRLGGPTGSVIHMVRVGGVVTACGRPISTTTRKGRRYFQPPGTFLPPSEKWCQNCRDEFVSPPPNPIVRVPKLPFGHYAG